MDPDAYPDPAFFVSDLQDVNKIFSFLKSLFAYYFLRVHLHHFSKIKSHKEVTKQQESMFFLLFLLDDRRIGYGPLSLTNGSGFGSGRPKNIWILRIRTRIRIQIRNTGYEIQKVTRTVHCSLCRHKRA